MSTSGATSHEPEGSVPKDTEKQQKQDHKEGLPGQEKPPTEKGAHPTQEEEHLPNQGDSSAATGSGSDQEGSSDSEGSIYVPDPL